MKERAKWVRRWFSGRWELMCGAHEVAFVDRYGRAVISGRLVGDCGNAREAKRLIESRISMFYEVKA